MDNLKLSEILKANNLAKKNIQGQKPFRIKVLSNITCNQLSSVLCYHLYNENVNPIIEFGNYDNIIQDSFSLGDYDLVIIHYDLLNILDKNGCYYEDYSAEALTELEDSIESELSLILDNISKVPSAIFNGFTASAISVNPLRQNQIKGLASRLNKFIISNKSRNTTFIDLDYILNSIGICCALDFKLYTLSKTLYTIDFWKKYTYVVSPLLLKLTGRSKKAIIFDCDNTLWHGILGEDGFNGIDMSFQSKIGAIFNKIQQIAVWLSKHGVIVGLCSKNNPEDIQDVLENHPDIVLTNKYIVVSEVNWNDKVSNLKSIAETLNIGLDSILFIDDSSFEINLVKEQLPLVKCIQVPDAIYDYPNYLMNEINKYFYFSDSKDDLDKTEQYKQQANRNKAKSQFNDIESFLSSLNIEISIAEDSRIDIERIAQLTQKTNQFNLCTNRYTDTQIQNFMDDVNHTIYSITVRDKFGCSGLTAVVIISIQNNSATIKDFIMSCRIMGRNIEYAIMYYLIGKLHEQGIDLVNADYVPTAKNKPVRDFYDSLGFNLCSEHSDIKHYSLDLQTYAPKEITYIKIV